MIANVSAIKLCTTMNELLTLKNTGAVLVDDFTSITLMYNCYLENIDVLTDRICKDVNIFIVKQQN